MEFLEEFEKIIATDYFKSAFPNLRLCTEGDIKIFCEELAEEGQTLFSVAENASFNDYFFYQESATGIEIGVFAIHAVVQIWESPEAFLAWLLNNIPKR